MLTISIYDHSDLTGDFTVSNDGAIVFPLLGQIKVAGLSIPSTTKMITNLLEKDYLYSPIVDVSVKEYKSKKVRIIGGVEKPGIYYLDGPTRLFDLLATAEGISPQIGEVTDGQKAHIARLVKGNGSNASNFEKVTTFSVDLHQLLVEGNNETNIYLQDGDVIYIPRVHSIHVTGQINSPGSYTYEGGMTVLKAITLAGGLTTKASKKTIVIKRIENGKVIKIKTRMADLLQPEDIVEVPLSFW